MGNTNKNNDKKLQTILDHTPAVIYAKDLDGKYLLINKQYEGLFKISNDDVIGKTDYDLFPQEYADKFRNNDREILNAGRSIQYEETAPHEDGEHQYISVKFPLFDDNNKPWAICGISTDISDRKRMETALRSSEDKFRTLFETSHIGIALWEMDGVLLEANKAFFNMLGYSEEDIFQVKYWNISSDKSSENKTKLLSFLADKCEVGPYETELIHKDGRKIPVFQNAIVIKNEKGIERIWTLIMDISIHKNTEQELQIRENNFEIIFRKNPGPIFITAVETGEIIDVNESFERISGYRREDVIGLKTKELELWVDPKQRDQIIAILKKEGFVHDIEVRGRLSNGEIHTFEMSFDIVNINNENVILTISKDITERKHYEQTLFQISQGLSLEFGEKLLVKLVKYLTTTLNADISFVGLLENDNRHKKIRTLSVYNNGKQVDNFSYELANTPCEKVLEQQVCIYPDNVQLDFPDDLLLQEMKIQGYVGAPLFNSKNEPVGIIVTLYRNEISHHTMALNILSIFAGRASSEIERMNVEAEQIHLEKQLWESQKIEAIGNLTSGIAHDFNNILASVMGYSDLAINLVGDDQEKLKRFITEINKAGTRAKDLVSKMLMFSRKYPGEPEAIKLQQHILDILNMLRSTIPSTINIRTDFSSLNDNDLILADSVQIQQIVINMLINARDAIGEQGEILIVAKKRAYKESKCSSCNQNFSGDMIDLCIQDSGIGISSEMQSKIFAPFFSTKEVGKGSGMGLSVVHGIVHSHDGHIELDSTPGTGSKFCLLFPAYEKQTVNEKKVVTVKQKNILDNVGGRILVVDDEEAIVSHLETLINNNGYEVVTTTSADEALKLIKQEANKLDLIITDQTMPEMTGLQLAKETKQIRPDLPVVLCTGYNESISESNLHELNLSAYFIKPIDSHKLLFKLGELLSHNNITSQ